MQTITTYIGKKKWTISFVGLDKKTGVVIKASNIYDKKPRDERTQLFVQRFGYRKIMPGE